MQIDFSEKLLHRFRAHTRDKGIAILFLRFPELDFVQELRFLQRRLTGIDHDIILVINDALQLPRAHVQHQPEP